MGGRPFSHWSPGQGVALLLGGVRCGPLGWELPCRVATPEEGQWYLQLRVQAWHRCYVWPKMRPVPVT